jgi:SAM-dependent methyltransferase
VSALPSLRLERAASAGRAAARVAEITNTCALCSDGESRALFTVDGALIVACRACGLVRQDTRPLAAAAVYDAGYYATDNPKGGYANYFLDADVNRRTFRDRVRAIERRYGRRGRLLDVGCALGDFLLEAKASGWDVEGVEISSFAAQRARERGLRVTAGRLEELALPDASFDVITLYDAIEHLTDPVATLAAVRRLLVPGGIVHLVTPNVGGLQARLLGRFWYHYKPGEHLFYFSPNTMSATVEAAGLVWLGWRCSSSYLTFTYCFNRLRYYAPAPFAFLEWLGRTFHFGPYAFKVVVGEMEAWALRENLRAL